MRLTAIIAAPLALAWIAGASPLCAQDHPHASTQAPAAPAGTPREPGQSAFAAIEEIAAILDEDPATDWSRVNMDRLREHLADMDNVLLRARVRATPLPGGARFTVTGEDDATRASIRSMVPAHAETQQGSAGLQLTSARTAEGAVLTVPGHGPAAEARIRALGFFGLLTVGGHHQQHHLAIATGRTVHH